MPLAHHNTTSVRSLRFLQPLLHTGFALSGVGTVLLGTILPRVSAQWHLRDKDAGLMLMVQFATSASGALLTRHNLRASLATGYALCGLGGLMICTLPQAAFLRLLVALGVFGLGLGLAMTSTNVFVGQCSTGRRGARLALLNFSWSAGAVACPLLVARYFAHSSGGTLFGIVGLLMLPFAVLPWIAGKNAFAIAPVTNVNEAPAAEIPVIAYFALLAFLYVGIEATIGNWISTYATRTATWSMAGGSIAVATFWGALLAGRGFTPLSLRGMSERRLYQVAAATVVAGVILLLRANSALAILAAAVVTGLSLAPLFPLTISLFFGEIGRSQKVGWVFAVAGLGGAAFSWLTGIVSSSAGSLRIGLLVPGTAALIMLALVAGRKPLRGRTPAE